MGARFGLGGSAVTAFALALAMPLTAQQPPALEPAAPIACELLADTDGDGRITKAEAGDAQWFDKVDKNGDGVLDAGELNVLRDALEKNGAGR